MPVGISIHIGVNHVDPKHYQSKKELKGCVNDALAMQKLAEAAGFKSTLLPDEKATVDAVLGAIDNAVGQVGSDGMLMLTYSGHGDVVVDVSRDELDLTDERWDLYDRELVDDQLFDEWKKFKKGARILVISDSCHAGDIFFAPAEFLRAAVERLPRTGTRSATLGDSPESRSLEPFAFPRVRRTAFDRLADVGAGVLLMAASTDDDTAKDGEQNGHYTKALLDTWNEGKFEGDYVKLHDMIYDLLRPRQLPVIRPLVPPAFIRDYPFRI